MARRGQWLDGARARRENASSWRAPASVARPGMRAARWSAATLSASTNPDAV